MNDEWESDEDDDVATLFALALHGEGTQRMKAKTQEQNYHTRADLLPNPRSATPWEAIVTTGLDVVTFHYLLSAFDAKWSSAPIPRSDVQESGEPRPGRRSLSSVAALELVLHFLNSTMPEHSLQQIFAITPSVCARYLRLSLSIPESVLRALPDARIGWPLTQGEFETYSEMIQLRQPLLVGGFCFVDGLNVPVAESLDGATQNAYCNGWTCSHYCSSVFAFARDGRIIFASLNCPGSWHDAAVARDIYDLLDRPTPEGYFAIADTEFPRNRDRMKGRIKVPLMKNDKRPRTLLSQRRFKEYDELISFNSQLISARQAAEWGMRALQGSFSRLKMPLPADNNSYRRQILEVCARLHQITTVRVGVNQIRNVYERIWRDDDEDALVYDHIRTMFFRDIARNDRIARFYRVEEHLIGVE